MSTSAVDLTTSNENIVASSARVRHSALYITAHDVVIARRTVNERDRSEGVMAEPIFGWLHQSSTVSSIDHGVIICPPIGYEQVHAHRSLRHLADRLAREAIPTLRFDWHGTGDSAGSDESPNRIRTWLMNIRQAAAWMRQHLGCHKISLVGLRIGATLATLVAEQDEIENLVLWSPVLKGRTYVREMKAIGLTSEAPVRKSQSPIPSNDIESAGFVLSESAAAELMPIDLVDTHPRVKQILVASRDDRLDDDRLCQRWAALGLHVRQHSVPGYNEMMLVPHRGQVPATALKQITEWLSNEIHSDLHSLTVGDDPHRTTSISIATAQEVEPVKDTRRIRETIFEINDDPHLFGIVSEPRHAIEQSLPTVLLVNAGTVHHVGPSRLYVQMARDLAAQGYRCLRMDLNGLGDSVAQPGTVENETYPSTAFRDIQIAMNELQRRYGANKIVLLGICSGAYAVFQSAAQIQNPTLVEAIPINPVTYFWKEGMSLDESPTAHLRTIHYYRTVALDPQKWLKLFTGRTRVGVGGAIKLVAKHLGIIRSASKTAGSSTESTVHGGDPTHPRKEDLPGDLARAVAFERKLAMFFSESDPGYSILTYHAKRKVRQLSRSGHLKIEFLPGCDHTFSVRDARRDLISAISKHLNSSYQPK